MVKAKKFIYAKAFQGQPKSENFKLEEFELPELKDDEVLCEAIFLSVDPYMRPYMSRFPVGSTMIGGQIAKVTNSKHSKFPTGSMIYGDFGWQTHTIFNPENLSETFINEPIVLPNFGNLPYSYALGCLGMPGNTAFFGFLEICQPKKGETVVITGAAGAVGCLVGQIAKIKGCIVVGFAGTDEKCKWLTNECQFDHAFNYKTCDITKSLKEAAPNGIDCYFDNVGGEISSTILRQMNLFGRVSVCGSISVYNENMEDLPKVTIVQPLLLFKQLKMEGFIVSRWKSRFGEGFASMLNWVKEGKIKYRETVTEGFENMPNAFMEMLNGKNIGKAIVKI
ncbi:prostaglandin reductase 1-like [Condylostylus longicornis]|uniref:prostaglandin reductase 1-like n=1 Tax=Condylostylus longicornis TaxID=2530218 RepID=UPI00244DC4FB|nr:prostaglandin reductase 1-like [Condylostylus longicornis]XP_055376174.1 prostaglandin reductase 1-like [Condylostylus longicornis]